MWKILCSIGACHGTSSYRPCWSRTHRDPPASASWVLRLKAYVTTVWLCLCFLFPALCPPGANTSLMCWELGLRGPEPSWSFQDPNCWGGRVSGHGAGFTHKEQSSNLRSALHLVQCLAIATLKFLIIFFSQTFLYKGACVLTQCCSLHLVVLALHTDFHYYPTPSHNLQVEAESCHQVWRW